MSAEDKRVALEAQHAESASTNLETVATNEPIKKKWWHPVKERGSVAQIIIAAVLAVAIGLIISTQVEGSPKLQPTGKRLVPILGDLWLRALKAVVMPLIICSMILAIQRLREVAKGGRALALWTVGYFVMTTLVAIVLSCIMVSLVWGPMFTTASDQELVMKNDTKYPDKDAVPIEEAVAKMFESFVPDNIFKALVNNELLAILITSIIVGCLLPEGDSSLLRAVVEVERIITIIITELIKLAPIGIFFLILGNISELSMASVGKNVGFLIGSTLANMGIHLFVLIPIVFFAVTRMNPYWYWLKNSSAWITAWGTASSAATLSVTLRCGRARGIPNTVCKFALPLGCLINMDGTAIYFPIAVVFLARTQGINLTAIDYVIICLLSTLSSIGTTPIPSSSLVLTVMIASSVGVPVTGMYSVIVAFDWFLDRFRTALNVSGDLFGAMVVYKITKIEDADDAQNEEVEEVGAADNRV